MNLKDTPSIYYSKCDNVSYEKLIPWGREVSVHEFVDLIR